MAVFIKPVNRTLLVEREPVPEKKNEYGILMPATSPQKVEHNCHVKLVASEDKSFYEKYVGKTLLVRASMLEDVEVNGTKGTFISENGVIAIISYSGML